MIKILIADDHALMREGLKQLIALEPQFQVVAEASSGSEVFDALRHVDVDLLLLDMSMSGICGSNLIERVRLHSDKPPILVLSMHSDIHVVRSALNAGAAGYLTKDCNPESLLNAIRKVAKGGRFIDAELAERFAFQADPHAERPPHALLSDREFAVFRLLAQGQTVNEIADELSISNKTVSTHKARLMQKMRCRTNAELVRYADAHGLAG
ncbi:MAG TPA: response regulator transcription factor [Pararobbsia sp.]|jgi:DNA-binding NarL/FixJ family response regulator|nr:response regulator transcription factor [Pararobbsia sp.]